MGKMKDEHIRLQNEADALRDYNQWRVRQIYDQAATEIKQSEGTSVDAIEKRGELRIRVDNWKKAHDWTKPQLKKIS